MKIKLLLAISDKNYSEHLVDVLMKKYEEEFELNICSSATLLNNTITANDFDIGLFDEIMLEGVNLQKIKLALLLWDEKAIGEAFEDLKKVYKYQRISALVSEMLSEYALVAPRGMGIGGGKNKAKVSVFWSPAGGTGKTSVAIAYAARRIISGATVTYISFEHFSSVPAFFSGEGRSISSVLERMDRNLEIQMKSIRQQDGKSGIMFFVQPDNFDDINILSANDIENLISAAATDVDELVVDLPSICDEKTLAAFRLADQVMLVTDLSPISAAKTNAFINQNTAYGLIKDKTVMVLNKGARTNKATSEPTIKLPLVQSSDPAIVYKTLSASSFDA